MQLVRAEQPMAIAAMMGAYLHELVPGTSPEYPQFDSWWQDHARLPYVIRMGGEDAGFALVRRHGDPPFHELAEFTVLPRFRRAGLGRAAARALFARHPGRWWLQVLDDNHVARRFWYAVAPPPVQRTRRCSDAGRAYSILQFVAGDAAD
jgi:predicted acetyltransferase